MAKDDEKVAERLRKAQESGTKALYLDDCGLTEIPEQVFELSNLEEISFNENKLTTIPERLLDSRRLRRVYLYKNPLERLPDLPGLRIDSETYIRCRLQIDKKNITGLDIQRPEWKGAEFEWPNELRGMLHLDFLGFDRCELERIPKFIFDLGSLEMLRFIACGLREVPADILRLHRLKGIKLLEDKIESPPPEVVGQGLWAIRDYWRQRADVGVDYLCEAKLIILGEAGAGKTSLARKIENPKYQLKEREPSTEGIDVIRYRFPTVLRPEGGEAIHRDFQVNIWDFGGQEIYHSTHQFFLTRRSVYLLVCDDRKEDTDFSYWLQAVEMLTDGSPLMIVQNEKQDRTRDINLSGLRAQYPNLRGAWATNLETNRGLEQVTRAIRKELEGLSHIGVGLPATWKRVREALEKDPRDYIGLAEYLAICEQHGFSRREDMLQLSGYLHDIGVCLHFQEDPVLRQSVVLKPTWGTDAVYRVLDDDGVIAARGEFTAEDLTRIWSEAKYSGMHHELLRLMVNFQLCYALEGEDKYIAPQLLSSAQPDYRWEASGGLVVRYEYGFLPKGIVTRFIVAMHRLIADPKLVWRTGVILERDGTRAEVTEAYVQRRIRVRVNGPDTRGLLAIVDEQLERLHRNFPRLKYDRFLPCPCQECQAKAEGYAFPLEALKKRAAKGQAIQCYESGESVNAADLIRDVLPSALRRERVEVDVTASPEVFVSYAWTPESSGLVDKLQAALEPTRLVREREELRYKDSIRDFMRRMGQGKAVVVVISEKYLKSENCMFEMLEVAKSGALRERIFPIVMPDANIYKATGRAAYVAYWEAQMHELDVALKGLRGDSLRNLQDDLTLYADIRRMFDGIVGMLRDMNAMTAEQHEGSGFDELIKRIRAHVGA